jgi:murein DD-endopeptidase MepM/ murein hydrolase activator NlpD
MAMFPEFRLPILRRVAISAFAFGLIYAVPEASKLQAQAKPASHREAGTADESGIKNVFWQPNQLQQGSVGFFTVEFERVPSRVTATWIGKTLTFFKTGDPKVWYTLAGDDLETNPGSYDFIVTALLANGRRVRSTKSIDVSTANFKSGEVDVPQQFVEPDAQQKAQIARDEVFKKQAFAHASLKPMWSGNFLKPVDGPSTPSFGESRILNEEKTSTHRGTDFPVKEGTSVMASNAGTVVLAKELFYEGNCVIVDHGQKFFTIYMHLSKINVHLGQKVEKGARLGLSGATGRVTGPHMHLGVRWNGAYLDPVGLLSLTLPKTTTGRAAAANRSHRTR